MEISKLKKIHMIGIKGVGMTMLAEYLHARGAAITGSDTSEIYLTDEILAKIGIKTKEKFDPENIPKDADLVVYSAAYSPEKNPELAAAVDGRVRTVPLAEAIGAVFNDSSGIAVAGSHGKTTTTAWLAFVLRGAGLDPSAMVGSRVPQFGGASILGKSNYLIVEADEYKNKLKYLNPQAVLLNNIDWDHPDYFPSRESYESSFVDFIKRIPKKGFLVANIDDPAIRRLAAVNCKCKLIGYSVKHSDADFYAYGISRSEGVQFFKARMGEDELGEFKIKLQGAHNILNALAVISASIELGAELRLVREFLYEFSGTARRMEYMGKFKGAEIFDDYAHHPTEIKATLEGARERWPGRRLVVVFHPHTFTRTKAYLDGFAKAFGAADELIVLDIYGSAREEQGGVHSRDLVKKIESSNSKIESLKYIPTLDEAENHLRSTAQKGDIIILMGAGDVFRIGKRLTEE
jgi:UDP-N-acetylmuramate--alanine ligase